MSHARWTPDAPSPTAGGVSGDREFGQRAAAATSPAGADARVLMAVNVVSDDELGKQRGGFVVDGLNIRLGAEITTFIDGQLSLTTTINWTDNTVTQAQTVSGVLTPASAAQLQAGLLQTGTIRMNVGDASVFLANNGQTAIVQRTNAGVQNLLINTANNTNIRTQVDAKIDVAGYSAYQASYRNGNMASALSEAVAAGTLGSVTR